MAIGRSIGAALFAVLAAAQTPGAARPASGSPAAQSPEAWITYGTPANPKRDDAVVGAGSVVAPPRAATADPWTSGAVLPIPRALAADERFTLAFWAKAAAPEIIPLTFQAREAPYRTFFEDRIKLTPRWQLFVRT